MNQGMDVSGRCGVVAGLFRDQDQGERALDDLKAAGFGRVEISRAGSDDDESDKRNERDEPTAVDARVPYDAAREGDRSQKGTSVAPGGENVTGAFFQEHDSSASSFAGELERLGFSTHDAHDLVDGLIKGHALVTADAGSDVARATAILERHHGDVRYTAGTQPNLAGAAGVTAASDTMTDQDREIQLRAERLIVNKQRVQHGEARIRKEIVTEMKSIDVPVSHEELVIERHAVTGNRAVDAGSFADETIRIPLTEEKVTVSKETIVREEVEVGTRRVEDVAQVSDTVRHEELLVDNAASEAGSRKTLPDKA